MKDNTVCNNVVTGLDKSRADRESRLTAFCGKAENQGVAFNTTCSYSDVTCHDCKAEVGRP